MIQVTFGITEMEYSALRALAARLFLDIGPASTATAARVALVDYLHSEGLIDKDGLVESIQNEKVQDKIISTPAVEAAKARQAKREKDRSAPQFPMRERDGRTTMPWLVLRWIIGNSVDKNWAEFTVADVAVGLQIKSTAASTAVRNLETGGWLTVSKIEKTIGGKKSNVYVIAQNARTYILSNQGTLIDEGLLSRPQAASGTP